jgi:hypothetical protein
MITNNIIIFLNFPKRNVLNVGILSNSTGNQSQHVIPTTSAQIYSNDRTGQWIYLISVSAGPIP